MVPAVSFNGCSQPNTLGVATVRPLAADLNADDGLAGSENRLHDVFDLIGDLGDRVADGPANMVWNGDSADLSQMPVDLEVTAIGRKEGKSDRCSLVQQLQFGCLVDHMSIPVACRSARPHHKAETP
jgi:hypothetical protein